MATKLSMINGEGSISNESVELENMVLIKCNELQHCSNKKDAILMKEYFNKCVCAPATLSYSINSSLKIAADELLPFVHVHEKDENVELCGPMANLLNMLSVSLHFWYSIKIPEDHKWGSSYKNGSWNGMIGMLQRQEVDIALGPFSTTYNRMQVVDFSYPLTVDRYVILTRKYKARSSFFKYLFALDWQEKNNDYPRDTLEYRKRNKKSTFDENSGTAINVKRIAQVRLRKGQLRALLLKSSSPVLIDNLEDLIRAEEIQPLITEGSSFHNLLKASGASSLNYKLLAKVKKKQSFILSSDLTSDAVLEQVEEGTHAVLKGIYTIRHALSLRVTKKKKCNLYISKESLYSKSFAIAFRKGLDYSLIRRINERILSIVEKGLFQKWTDEMSSNYSFCLIPDQEVVSPFTVQDIVGIMFLLLSGWLLATLLFIFEKLSFSGYL
ncbi:putative glutamate receptor [Tachypleus tridentatus]|uniref:putative glutamate receptor n=1 Tax=Tachypleus tridentatus TaxID=6853 RepID=UPI003FD40E1A